MRHGAPILLALDHHIVVLTGTYEFDAFGNEIYKSGTTPNNYLYRGEQFDPDLSMYYLRARYYDPVTGRFLSRDPEDGDPTDPASMHKYVYADGEPVDGLDPTGRIATTGEGFFVPGRRPRLSTERSLTWFQCQAHLF
jgi:RHS repeat-associated protein